MYIKSLFLTLLINSLKYFNLLLNYTLIFENLSYDKNEQVCIISYQSKCIMCDRDKWWYEWKNFFNYVINTLISTT